MDEFQNLRDGFDHVTTMLEGCIQSGFIKDICMIDENVLHKNALNYQRLEAIENVGLLIGEIIQPTLIKHVPEIVDLSRGQPQPTLFRTFYMNPDVNQIFDTFKILSKSYDSIDELRETPLWRQKSENEQREFLDTQQCIADFYTAVGFHWTNFQERINRAKQTGHPGEEPQKPAYNTIINNIETYRAENINVLDYDLDSEKYKMLPPRWEYSGICKNRLQTLIKRQFEETEGEQPPARGMFRPKKYPEPVKLFLDFNEHLFKKGEEFIRAFGQLQAIEDMSYPLTDTGEEIPEAPAFVQIAEKTTP